MRCEPYTMNGGGCSPGGRQLTLQVSGLCAAHVRRGAGNVVGAVHNQQARARRRQLLAQVHVLSLRGGLAAPLRGVLEPGGAITLMRDSSWAIWPLEWD